ncbi:MAG: efflux RND transporter periplasmic adaptor subunit [Candidatus Kapaibacteriota bacterium]|jgi:HlyD family secretion protein
MEQMKKKKKNKKILIILPIMLILAGVTVYFVFFNKKDDTIEVTTTKVIRKDITQTVNAIGKIQPETEVKVSSELSGELIQLNIKEGDEVKNGMMIAKIKPDIIESQLEQLKAQVDGSRVDIDFSKTALVRAEQDFKRKQELFEKKFIPLQELEISKTSFEQAKSNLESAYTRLKQSEANYKQTSRNAERTTLFSPIDGVVTKLNVEKGEKVLGTMQFQGTELMIISDLSIMNAVVEVDENDVVLIDLGDTCEIEIDAFPNKTFKGQVIEIGHSAIVTSTGTQDQVTKFQVKVRLFDKDIKLRPGMSCSVDIKTETKYNVLSIPLGAVTVRAIEKESDVKDGKWGIEKEEIEKEVNEADIQSVVFSKKGNIAKQKNIKTGISDNGFIEVKSGLDDNEEIISGSYTAVSKLLKDSSKIKLQTVEVNKNKSAKKY